MLARVERGDVDVDVDDVDDAFGRSTRNTNRHEHTVDANARSLDVTDDVTDDDDDDDTDSNERAFIAEIASIERAFEKESNGDDDVDDAHDDDEDYKARVPRARDDRHTFLSRSRALANAFANASANVGLRVIARVALARVDAHDDVDAASASATALARATDAAAYVAAFETYIAHRGARSDVKDMNDDECRQGAKILDAMLRQLAWRPGATALAVRDRVASAFATLASHERTLGIVRAWLALEGRKQNAERVALRALREEEESAMCVALARALERGTFIAETDSRAKAKRSRAFAKAYVDRLGRIECARAQCAEAIRDVIARCDAKTRVETLRDAFPFADDDDDDVRRIVRDVLSDAVMRGGGDADVVNELWASHGATLFSHPSRATAAALESERETNVEGVIE